MIRKLQRKFILAALLAVFLVLAAIVGIANLQSYRSVGKTADETLALLAENNGAFPERMFRTQNGGELPPELPTDGEEPPEQHENGRERGEKDGFSAETPFQTRFFTVELDESGAVVATNTENIAAVDGEAAKAYAAALFAKNKTSGYADTYRYIARKTDTGTLYIFVDCARDLDTFRSFLRASLLIGGVGFAVVALLIVLFSGVVVRPVAETYQKQKRFITDAGHELKTPLTVIGASCEVLELETGENEWTSTIKEQVDRLAGLTDKLVFLARVDEGSTRTVMTDFSLSELANEAVSPFAAVARAQGKTLESEIAPRLTLHGDVSMIRQLFTLLLDNAMKYSTAGSTVRAALAAAGKNKVFAVTNDTAGVPTGDLSALFERFYRTDASRNSETGGHGIGLSVAKAIAELHGGKIAARSPDGKTITFTVTLP